MSEQHSRYMRIALSLARRQLGRTCPNPSVGAIIVKNGQIIAQGVTANGGRPHAETIAIENAGTWAKDATLYVSLEPCSHHGKTPPCTEAIIKSGIGKVVVACSDKNPVVSGSGIAALKNAGIEVIENICEKEALEINRGFFSVIEKKRPYIALKIATSLDGKITIPSACHPALVAGSGAKPTVTSCNFRPRNECVVTEKNKIKWLTSEHARNYGHLLRSQYDAILTGSGTIIIDNPELTCRLNGLEKYSPLRIVLDRNNRIPKDAKILNDGRESWIFTGHGLRVVGHKKKEQITHDSGLMTHDHNLSDIVVFLAEKGITRILVEAGAKLTTAFLESGLVDRVYWFRAPIVVGEAGLSATAALSKLASFKQIEYVKLGNDNLDILECI